MSSSVDKSVEKFLRSQFGDEDAGIGKVVLTHAQVGSTKSTPVDTYEPQELNLDNVELLASEIVSRAQADADGLGGVQRYVISAYNKSEGKARARFAFRLRGDDEVDGTPGEEAANLHGLTSQLMRHNESNFRTVTSSVGMVVRAMGEQLHALQSQNAALLKSHMDVIRMREEAESLAHERDLELLKSTNDERRKDALYEKLALLAPSIINKFVGRDIIPADDPGAMMISGFASSLTQEQMAQITSTLTVEQQIALGQIIQSSRSPRKQLKE